MFDLRDNRRCAEWIGEPFPEIAVGKEIEPKQRCDVGERPSCLRKEVKPLQQEKGKQCCPNLDAQSILGGSDEGFDLQILFE